MGPQQTRAGAKRSDLPYGKAQRRAPPGRGGTGGTSPQPRRCTGPYRKNHRRLEQNQVLFERQLISAQEFAHADTAMRQAEAKLHALREKDKREEAVLELVRINGREVAIKEANLKVRNAEVRRAEADLADLRRKLELMTIVSPVRGTVAKKNARPGEVVHAANLFLCLSTPAGFGWRPMWKKRRSASSSPAAT